jgi:catechol 2,3-dioxygenase-like lactoylglutathione lyase family enzyme
MNVVGIVRLTQRLFGVIFMSFASMSTHATDAEFQKLGVYVVVAEIPRAIEFYAGVFDKQPYVATETFAAFEVAGGVYALFAAHASDVARSRGNSTVPYIRVRDAGESHARLAALQVRLLDQRPVQEGPIALFRFVDPDENVVEMFSIAAR